MGNLGEKSVKYSPAGGGKSQSKKKPRTPKKTKKDGKPVNNTANSGAPRTLKRGKDGKFLKK